MRRIFISLLVAGVFTGCNDFLDKMPDNRTEIDSGTKVKTLLVSAYPKKTYFSLVDARMDGMVDYGSTFMGEQPKTTYAFSETAFKWGEFDMFDNTDTHENYWTDCYTAIAAANHALEAIPSIGNDPKVPLYQSEAYLCRAYAHLCLLSLYSNMFDYEKVNENPGVPYVTKPEDKVFIDYDRGTVASTLEAIRDDINKGLANVGTTGDFEQPYFHFYWRPARALATRYALFTRDYNAVISHATTLLGVPQKFLSAGETNGDGTPAMYVDPTDAVYITMYNSLTNWPKLQLSGLPDDLDRWGDAVANPKTSGNLLTAQVNSLLGRALYGTYYVRHAYDGDYFASLIGSNLTGASWAYRAYRWTSGGGDRVQFIPKMREDFKVTNITEQTGETWIKVNLFRLEEVLLSRAEAYTLTGQYDKAIADLNLFCPSKMRENNLNDPYVPAKHYVSRDKMLSWFAEELDNPNHWIHRLDNAKYYFTTTDGAELRLQKALILTIIKFRETDFIYEGLHWFDILRWNIPVEHRTYDGKKSTLLPTDPRRILQLPQTAVLSNVKLNDMTNAGTWN